MFSQAQQKALMRKYSGSQQQAWRPAIDDARPPPARVYGQLELPVVGRNRGVAQHNHGVGDAADLDTAEGVR